MAEIVISKIKCPKCKSTTLRLIEVWKGHAIHWQQTDGKFDREDGYLEPGDPYKVRAECDKCKHEWTIKNATDIANCIPD